METLGTHGYGAPSLGQTRLDQRAQSSGGDDEQLSDNEMMSRDGDSPDALSRVPPSDVDPDTLEKLKRQEREERDEIEAELKAHREAMSGLSPSGSLGHDNNNHGLSESAARRDLLRTPSSTGMKEPPPLGLAGLEAFRREYLTSPLSHLRGGHPLLPHFPPLGIPQSTAAALQLAAESGFGKLPLTPVGGGHHGGVPLDRGDSRGGDRGHVLMSHSRGATPPASAHSTPSSEFSSQQNWSFEEQFKQLYELNDDPKRKEFLDDIFNFMQKRGTPINRLPIMAKQVLDLYELYNLVTARGGLVEVINKKQWQEIIKGLNLPSSITSAAFTLRTQYSKLLYPYECHKDSLSCRYTKYLYPYECQMKNLSSPSELQCAIDGNKREGRRTGYDTYSMFPGPRLQVPLPPSSLPMPQISPLPPGLRPSFNGGGAGFPGSLTLEMTRLALFKMYNQAGIPPGGGPPGPPGHMAGMGLGQAGFEMGRVMMEQQARALQAAREAEAREKDKEAASKSPEVRLPIIDVLNNRSKDQSSGKLLRQRDVEDEEDDMSPPPLKRERQDSFEGPGSRRNGSPLAGANIRIANKGESGDSSLVVSLEINSVMYQGVLFAQPTASSGGSKVSSTSKDRNSSKENRIS